MMRRSPPGSEVAQNPMDFWGRWISEDHQVVKQERRFDVKMCLFFDCFFAFCFFQCFSSWL